MLQNILKIPFVLVIAFGCCKGVAQVLEKNESVRLLLSDHSTVVLHKKRNAFDEQSMEYYYLPSHLRFSTTTTGEKEFSFLSYKEENQDNGAIIHFLATWGLNKRQLEEAQRMLIESKGPNAVLMGAIMPSANGETIAIEGKNEIAAILNRSQAQLGKIPTTPNSKTAASFHLNEEDAIVFEKAIKNDAKELKEVYLVLNFQLKFTESGSAAGTVHYSLKQNFKTLLNQ
ncbi:hypothetical protein ACFQ1M_05690 [Sungkyunkwania multivorans]|uniref:Uncharacterized protein n=1 Tax=Sungkyunkwania multivorans TaxID=1173618 RepID=A0ABW3CV99_9FLAO